MNLNEMLCTVTEYQPLGSVDFHAYRKEYPVLDMVIRGLAINTGPPLSMGVVSLDEVFCSILSWFADAIYNFGPPDDLRILPVQGGEHGHSE